MYICAHIHLYTSSNIPFIQVLQSVFAYISACLHAHGCVYALFTCLPEVVEGSQYQVLHLVTFVLLAYRCDLGVFLT